MSVDQNTKKENILTSWKAIAAYLDRDVRTCVRWEQRYGLPVHRLDRDSKAKVFAYRDEIDRWLAERSAATLAPAGSGTPIRAWFRPVPIAFALIGLAAAGYFLYWRPARSAGPAVPEDFLIRGPNLIVTNAQGRELWRHDSKRNDLLGNEAYHEHFQLPRHSAAYAPIWPWVMIRDLDGDGRLEFLFAAKTESETREGVLIVFNEKGREKWRFSAGAALTFGGTAYRREYRIFGFTVDDFDGDGRPEVLVLSFHKPDFPCQAVLLDTAGRLEGEYWNAGYLMDADAADVDLDGTKELLLSGVNNEYARGCLAVFKPGQLQGSSPQISEAYRSPELNEGRQSVYILFPVSDVHAARRVEGDPVNYFWIHEGGGFAAETTESFLIYEFDASLRCRYVTLSNPFKNLHNELTRAGLVRSLIDEAYKKRLLDGFRYFAGGRWLPSAPIPSPGPTGGSR